MSDWTKVEWIPVERQLPEEADGPSIAGGMKVAVLVLTVDMVLNGLSPDARGFHMGAQAFDDDEKDGRQRVMFWAPCDNATAVAEYGVLCDLA